VVLDVMLPDGNGLELLRTLRTTHAGLPVLMLSARGEPTDRILGLELGADDYLSKPCDPRELTARLKAVLRRSQASEERPAPPVLLRYADLEYSPARGIAILNGEEVSLTVSEGEILEVLLSQPEEPIEKHELTERALDRKLTLYDRSIDMHISNLRRKLGPNANGEPRIISIRGRGYLYTRGAS
jgi:DNA-binding response OmpR family regulator